MSASANEVERWTTGTSRRSLFVSWAVLALASAPLWFLVIRQAQRMGVGPGTMGMALPVFLAMWVGMMTAMMLPSIAPASIRSSITARGVVATRLVVHLVGFFVPWAAFGVGAYAALAIIGREAAELSPEVTRWLGVAVVAAAGVYQVTPWKRRAIAHCREMAIPMRNGVLAALRSGLRHGTHCVGCCWGFMMVMLVVGVMSVPAMVALAGVIFLEKVPRRGVKLASVVGVAFLALAALAAVYPSTLGGLHQGGSGMDMGSMGGFGLPTGGDMGNAMTGDMGNGMTGDMGNGMTGDMGNGMTGDMGGG